MAFTTLHERGLMRSLLDQRMSAKHCHHCERPLSVFIAAQCFSQAPFSRYIVVSIMPHSLYKSWLLSPNTFYTHSHARTHRENKQQEPTLLPVFSNRNFPSSKKSTQLDNVVTQRPPRQQPEHRGRDVVGRAVTPNGPALDL